MMKQQDCSIIAYIFLFLTFASQIQCTSPFNTTHFHAIRRESASPPRTTLSGVNQQELKQKDLINQLPGQPPVSFRQYGGYVAVNESSGRFFYYYFVETSKANNSSPLVIWFNGGPGCSSLLGAFKEHGPFRVHSDGKTLYRNPYSWNNEANMLYVESPAKVGFSYTNTLSDLKNQGDKNTAADNYVFLVKWLEKFSEYKGRDLYITGESYAGHYCPQLAQMILHNKNQTFINLQGILIGNPALDRKIEEKGGHEYLVNHGLISHESPRDKNNPFMGIFVDLYNVYAPTCQNTTLTSIPKEDTTITNFDPCSLEYMTAYLNRANVQEAMHANTTKLPYMWTKCNMEANSLWSMKDRYASMIPIIEELTRNGVRVWVYSGDTDAIVSYTATLDVLRNMNLTVKNIWRPWFSEREVGGFTKEYKNKFTYTTVRGAGHRVPSDQPIRALTLFTSFIRNTPLPETP